MRLLWFPEVIWCLRVEELVVLLFLVVSELVIDPEHANEHAKCYECKDAILVIGQIDACFDEKQNDRHDTRNREWLVKELISLLLLPSVIRGAKCFLHGHHDEVSFTDCGQSDHQPIVNLIGDKSADGRERAVDRQEVDETDYVSPIVFVLQRSVDQVYDHH